MLNKSLKQTGSSHIVLISAIVIFTLGVLGYLFWQNFLKPHDAVKKDQVSQQTSNISSSVCANSNGAVEKEGTFCSEDVGIEFKLPEVFANKLQKEDNYDVFEGSMEDPTGSPDGKSLEYYVATISTEKETLTLSVAQEPLRSGYSNISHALQNTYFNQTDGSLSLINAPTREYDSSTGTFKTTGNWSVGESVPFENVGGIKIYHGKTGDAGTTEDGYLMVVKGKIIVIKIKHAINPMNNPTLDVNKAFTELDTSLKAIKFLN